MPFTLSHAAAALPFRKYCPQRLDMLALMLGTITPDLAYYWRDFNLAAKAHTFGGSLVICLPLGLAAFYLIRAFSKEISRIFNGPFREFIENIKTTPSKPISIIASVLLGAWTHVIWDSFTHRNGSVVTRIPWLAEDIFSLAGPGFGFGTGADMGLGIGLARGIQIPVYSLLQHLSSTFGLTVLAVAAYRYYRRKRSHEESTGRWHEGRIARIWVSCIFLASIFSAGRLMQNLPALDSGLNEALRKLVFHGILDLVGGTVLFLAIAVVILSLNDRFCGSEKVVYNENHR